MEPNQKLWNEQHQALQRALARPADHAQAVELFLSVHAMVHSTVMSQAGLWSFEDEVCQDLDDTGYRRIPAKQEHSIAWILWHLSRIEDITMNMLVADCPQVLNEDNWIERMKVSIRDTGNVMDTGSVAELSATIDLAALRAYRVTVGRRTREIVKALPAPAFKQKVDPSRLQRVLDEGAVLEEARGLLDYWGKKTIGGLLLMPPTRHNIVHWNEALRIKKGR